MSTATDPRVFLAAERSLLAWNRTCLAMMGFGFVIERFGLLLRLMNPLAVHQVSRGASFWIGLVLVLFSAVLAVLSTMSFSAVVATIAPQDRPATRFAKLALIANLGVAVVGILLAAYLALAAAGAAAIER